MKQERLDKLLAGSGLYSRSEARRLVVSGAVAVNGETVREPEKKVSRGAKITASGSPVDTAEHVYYMLHKPAGYVSASKREGVYPPVTELLPAFLRKREVFCVGRLDADVTGLLILTDDGEYAHRVTSPRAEISKVYEVRTDAPLDAGAAEILSAGVTLKSGVRYRPAALEGDPADPCLYRLTVTEGKFHEVKNLIAVLDRRVTALRRVSVGGLTLDESLTPGAYRRMEESEAARVFI